MEIRVLKVNAVKDASVVVSQDPFLCLKVQQEFIVPGAEGMVALVTRKTLVLYHGVATRHTTGGQDKAIATMHSLAWGALDWRSLGRMLPASGVAPVGTW